MHVAFYSYKTHTTEGLILGLEIYAKEIPIQGLQWDNDEGSSDVPRPQRRRSRLLRLKDYFSTRCHDRTCWGGTQNQGRACEHAVGAILARRQAFRGGGEERFNQGLSQVTRRAYCEGGGAAPWEIFIRQGHHCVGLGD